MVNFQLLPRGPPAQVRVVCDQGEGVSAPGHLGRGAPLPVLGAGVSHRHGHGWKQENIHVIHPSQMIILHQKSAVFGTIHILVKDLITCMK